MEHALPRSPVDTQHGQEALRSGHPGERAPGVHEHSLTQSLPEKRSVWAGTLHACRDLVCSVTRRMR